MQIRKLFENLFMCSPPKASWNGFYNGVWRSLVARLIWDQEVVGSNPATPTPDFYV